MDKRKRGKIIVNGNCTCCGKKLNGHDLFLCNECQIKIENERITKYPEFEIREYPPDEYKADMLMLLNKKGLYGAVKVYLDKIMEEASNLSYIPHMTIAEFCNDVLFLVEMKKDDLEFKQKVIDRKNELYYKEGITAEENAEYYALMRLLGTDF